MADNGASSFDAMDASMEAGHDPQNNKISPPISAALGEGDVENQQQSKSKSKQDASGVNVDIEVDDASLKLEKPLSSSIAVVASTSANVGIFAEDEEGDTASVFSFDSYEKNPRIPLRIQNMIHRQQQQQNQNNGGTRNNNLEGSAVPFPSVVGASIEYESSVNVCPCRCLFFTLKETICLIMSFLGCAVFMAGLVVLCMFLEGSLFNNSQK